jgi:hypothetical protein
MNDPNQTVDEPGADGRLQGPTSTSGTDLDFRALEQIAAAAARGLTEGTLATLLEQQTQALPAEQPCPDCGRLGPVGSEARPLTVRGNPAIRKALQFHTRCSRKE